MPAALCESPFAADPHSMCLGSRATSVPPVHTAPCLACHSPTRGAPNTAQGTGKDKSEKKGTSARYAQAQGWKGKGAAPKRAQ